MLAKRNYAKMVCEQKISRVSSKARIKRYFRLKFKKFGVRRCEDK
jgi:hypothetical protein